MLAVYQHTQTQVFVSAVNDMYIVTAIITAAGVFLALMLHSGSSAAAVEPDGEFAGAEGPPPEAEREAGRQPGAKHLDGEGRANGDGHGGRERLGNGAGHTNGEVDLDGHRARAPGGRMPLDGSTGSSIRSSTPVESPASSG
jgi:hypothetical protein